MGFCLKLMKIALWTSCILVVLSRPKICVRVKLQCTSSKRVPWVTKSLELTNAFYTLPVVLFFFIFFLRDLSFQGSLSNPDLRDRNLF